MNRVSVKQSKVPAFQVQKGKVEPGVAYLPDARVNRDHEGGSLRARLFHCTPAELTPTIVPNVNNSSV